MRKKVVTWPVGLASWRQKSEEVSERPTHMGRSFFHDGCAVSGLHGWTFGDMSM
jgi:hypothetical protein